jgi:DUF4097 and DUF4098 domain-containing protein YvlB
VRVRVIALFVLLACGLALPAVADQWSKSYPVTGKPDLWVSTGDGSVRIDVWDEARIEARIETVGYVINKDFQLIESQSGNQVKIEAKFPNTSWGLNLGQRSLTVTLKVPRESNLDIHTGDGSMTVNGAKGEHRFQTGDGRIEATGLDGRLHASSGDGGVSVEGRFDLLDLHTGDGAVEAAAKPGSTIGSPWSVKTGDGGVTLRLPADLQANIDAHTGDGGVTLGLPLAASGSLKRSSVQGTLNGGGGPLTVRTGDGAIRLEKY